MRRIGLIVGRFQPFHNGHADTVNNIIQDCSVVIIGLGSAQLSRERHNPWTVDERKEMLRNVYGDRIRVVPLKDLNASTPAEWTNYVIEKAANIGLPAPTDYYTGSVTDGIWYRDHFAADWEGVEAWIEETGNDWSDFERYRIHSEDANSQPDSVRRLHVNERRDNGIPSATEVRGFLELRDDGWKQWVPAVNHELVESTYPEEFKIPLK